MLRLFLTLIFLLPLQALAVQVELQSGKVIDALILRMSTESITFLEIRPRESKWKPEAEVSLFREDRHDLALQNLAPSQVTSIAGLPTQVFYVVWSYNVLYNLFAKLDTARRVLLLRGNIWAQVKTFALFLLLLIVGVPAAIRLISLPLPGQKPGFLAALLLTIFFTAVGYVLAQASVFLAGAYPFLSSPTSQVLWTIVFVVLCAGLIHLGSKFHFLHGLVFNVVWWAGLLVIAQVTMGSAGVYDKV